MTVDLPAAVRNKARSLGLDVWIDELPNLVRSLATDWELTVGRTYADGTEAYVAEVTLAAGTPAVLKVLLPRDPEAVRHEATVLRLAAGEGCATLLGEDVARGALLLERLGPSMHDLGLPFTVRLPALADTAARVWRSAPDEGLPTGADKARWLADFIGAAWERLSRPCSAAAVEHALSCAARREAAHDDERAVLVHGDVHEWNALASGDGFKLIDPDGLLAEAEYDLGVLMREDPLELLDGDPFERARFLADRTGLDATAIWEWGVVERVSTGLLCTEIGLQPVGHQMLAAADHVADAREAGRMER